MSGPAHSRKAVRFGAFDVDVQAGELRRQGMKVKLQEKPFQVLALLLEQPRAVVTREELQKRLWPTDTFVDFDHGLNIAVAKLREALGDSAETPRFVETLPRRGYRFIYPVEVEEGEAPTEVTRRRLKPGWIVAVVLVVLGAGLVGLNVGGSQDWLRGGPAAGEIRSIGVLPLQNLSGDPEQEYFADGMTEALITELAKISTLRVISRQSVMQFKGTNKPLPEIARQLRVDALVEGSAMREGDRVRITAQLIQALPEQHLWAESYQRELRDVLRLQGEISRTIAHRIQAKVVSRGAKSVNAIALVNPQAYDGYLRARYNISRSELQATLQAVEYLQETIRLSPDFAPAHAALADAYFMLGQPLNTGSAVEARQYFSLAEAAAHKALELDDSLAEAHSRLGQILLFRDWDWNAARRETERALELDPNSLFALYSQGIQLTMLGRFEASLPFMRRALERDPVNVMTRTLAAELLLYARQYDAAETELRRVLEMDPEYARAHEVAAWLYELRGQGKEAADAYAKSGALGSEDAASLAGAFRATGMRGFYTWWVRLLGKREDQQDSAAINAHFYAGLGDRERALQHLEKAFQERDSNLLFCKINPWLDPLRGDPRFQDLLRRMNFPR